MITVYLVGPLFTEADQRQRRLEGERLRRELTARQLEYQLISPIDLPLNEGGASAPEAIFEADYHYQCERMCFSIWPMRIPAVIWRWGFCWRKN